MGVKRPRYSRRSERLPLRVNFGWTFLSNTVSVAALWGIVAVLTKLGNPTMVGRLELGRTITLPVLAIAMLHLRAAQVTDAKGQYAFEDYFGTRLITAAIGFAAIAVISLGWYGGDAGWVILLWGLAKSIDSVSDIVRGLFQQYERMNISGISLMIRSVLALLAAIVIIRYFDNLLLAIVLIASVWLLALLLYDLPQAYFLLSAKSAAEAVRYRLSPRFDIKTILSLVRLALPLGAIMFLIALQSSVPRGVLEAYHGVSALGYFGPIAYPIAMCTIVVRALGESASPRLAQYYVKNPVQYRRLMRKLLILAAIMGMLFVAGVVFVGKPVLTILYTAEYAEYHPEFIMLSIGAALSFAGSFCGYGITAARMFKMAMFLKIIPCAAAVGMSFWLIPSYGVRGAAFTSAVVFAIGLACSFAALIWIVKKKAGRT